MAKTVVNLGVVRKIRTAEYEQLDISVNITEEIEWSGDAQREALVNNVIKHLNGDFERTYAAIADSIGLTRHIGGGKVSNGKGKVSEVNVVEEDDDNEVDIF